MQFLFQDVPIEIVGELTRQYGLEHSIEVFFNQKTVIGTIQTYFKELKDECRELLDDPVTEWMTPEFTELTRRIESFEQDQFALEVKIRCEQFLVGSIEFYIRSRSLGDKLQDCIDGLKKELVSGRFIFMFYHIAYASEQEYLRKLENEIRNLTISSQFKQYFGLLGE